MKLSATVKEAVADVQSEISQEAVDRPVGVEITGPSTVFVAGSR